MIAATLLFGLVLFLVAAVVPDLLPLPRLAWLPQTITKLVMLLEAVLLMLLSRRPFAEFGFRRGHGPSAGLVVAALGLGAVTTAFILIAGLAGLRGMLKNYTFLQLVLTIWIWSSLVEEIFVRGWLQTTLARRGAGPRAQILLSGGFFGFIHLSLFMGGIDAASVFTIVTATFLLGLICATLRQRTESLIAPIAAHVAFNFGGIVGGIIGTIVTKTMR